MPAAGFTFIEQYQSLAKNLEQHASDEDINYDQQVPQPSFEKLIKSEIKTESEDNQECPYMDAMFNSSGAHDKVAPDNFLSTIFSPDASYNHEHTDFLTNRASPSSCFSSSTLLTPVLPSPPQFLSTSRTNSYNYIHESGTSGCVVTENSNGESSNDHSLEYIDLDKQKFYDVLDPYSSSGKLPFLMEEPNPLEVPLEEAVLKMHNDIRNDSDKLNIPFDPYLWSRNDVQTFVQWVCNKNSLHSVAQVCHKLSSCDGQQLCSLKKADLSSLFGQTGVFLYNELELWKAANNFFPSNYLPCDIPTLAGRHCYHETSSEPTYVKTSVSPAPSTSSSHDSTISTHSDHSDDEPFYAHPRKSPVFTSHEHFTKTINKVPSGRGHKQTIHLWQFLKELLLSNENHSDCIRWVDRPAGIFKIEDSKKVAHLWGSRKNRPAMNYDKLSRSVRQYYKKGIIKKTEQSKRLVYQFCAGYL
ncbi:SAM pointed domain-containing Ets transcription factor-like [Physella acuta]|uniref:SAM pointed domain-containing Ets transcription factor-like n=1 Tax=Physella acuta TaxID=109671 RepID=UPI0027DE7FF2|nr:SAM pointed domain-containing Ets transcription factor-like [Physella acuta]